MANPTTVPRNKQPRSVVKEKNLAPPVAKNQNPAPCGAKKHPTVKVPAPFAQQQPPTAAARDLIMQQIPTMTKESAAESAPITQSLICLISSEQTTPVQQQVPVAVTRVQQQLQTAATPVQQQLPVGVTSAVQQQLFSVQQQLSAVVTRVETAAKRVEKHVQTATKRVQQQPQTAVARDSTTAAPDQQQPDQNPPPVAVGKSVNEFVRERREKRKQELYQKYLQLSLKSALASCYIVTDKNQAYRFMNEHGVALIKKGITITEQMHATIGSLCTGTNDVNAWDSIFEKIGVDGKLSEGTGRRQQLVFNKDWKQKFTKSPPRDVWKRQINDKVNKFLKVILTRAVSAKYKPAYHTLIRSARRCPNQCWHYDQFYPESDAWRMRRDKEFPFVVIVALEEKELTFLDVEVDGQPKRICMEKGDVLLVRGDCLHRGTDFKYAPAGKKYHVRGHAYIDPKDFQRQENTTFAHNKYPTFLQDYYR